MTSHRLFASESVTVPGTSVPLCSEEPRSSNGDGAYHARLYFPERWDDSRSPADAAAEEQVRVVGVTHVHVGIAFRSQLQDEPTKLCIVLERSLETETAGLEV